MGYQITTVTLSSARKTTVGPAGLVHTKQDIEEYLRDYRAGVHNEPYILLSESLTQEFEKYEREFGKRLLESLGGFALSAVTANGPGLLFNLGKLAAEGPGKNFSSDGFDKLRAICAWKKRMPFKYNCGRSGMMLR